MSDILTAMREFRVLDDKRRSVGLGGDEEVRWNALRAAAERERRPLAPQWPQASDWPQASQLPQGPRRSWFRRPCPP